MLTEAGLPPEMVDGIIEGCRLRQVGASSAGRHVIDGSGRRGWSGNVPNDGLIDNLPAGCCVEVPCLVDRSGVQPTRVGALPPHLAALMQTNINVRLTSRPRSPQARAHLPRRHLGHPRRTGFGRSGSVDDLIEAPATAARISTDETGATYSPAIAAPITSKACLFWLDIS
jgi:hypothetical protein